jgi:hypothetical protein
VTRPLPTRATDHAPHRDATGTALRCKRVPQNGRLAVIMRLSMSVNSPSGSDWRMGQLLNLAERRWGLTTAREPVAHRPGQRAIPLGVGSLMSHSHVGGLPKGRFRRGR